MHAETVSELASFKQRTISLYVLEVYKHIALANNTPI